MSEKVYYFSWVTDSGDRGLSYVKRSKWSEEDVDEYFKKYHSCDYECETIFVEDMGESCLYD